MQDNFVSLFGGQEVGVFKEIFSTLTNLSIFYFNYSVQNFEAMNILVVNSNSNNEEGNIQNQKLFYSNFQWNI